MSGIRGLCMLINRKADGAGPGQRHAPQSDRKQEADRGSGRMPAITRFGVWKRRQTAEHPDMMLRCNKSGQKKSATPEGCAKSSTKGGGFGGRVPMPVEGTQHGSHSAISRPQVKLFVAMQYIFYCMSD